MLTAFIAGISDLPLSGVSVFKRMTLMNEWGSAMHFVHAPIWLQ
jgi:hypothetical protein